MSRSQNKQISCRAETYRPRTIPLESLYDHFPQLEDSFEAREAMIIRADLNEAGTFKESGARCAVSRIAQHTPDASVLAVSAGNHAKGMLVAVSDYPDMDLTVVIPENAPPEKSTDLPRLWKELGGDTDKLRIVSHGLDVNEALVYARNNFAKKVFVHPFDDPDVIDGQGRVIRDVERTIGKNALVLMTVGGGGLLAGSVKHSASTTSLMGVEIAGSNSLSRSLTSKSQAPTAATNPNRLFAGANVAKTGHHVLETLRAHGFSPDSLTTVHADEVIELAKLYQDQERLRVTALEPTSLIAVAAMVRMIERREVADNKRLAVVATGHNESFQRLLATSARPGRSLSSFRERAFVTVG